MAGSKSLKTFYTALAAIVVLGAGALLVVRARSSQAVVAPPVPVDVGGFPGHILGSDSAPVTIVEYADFQCPACAEYAVLTEPDVRQRLVATGQVRVIYHDFPLEGHANSMPAHHAAQCADEQGKFWQMHDQLYFNQGQWALERRPQGTIRDLAAKVGLDMDQYDACMKDGRYMARLEQERQEAIARGVAQTPTFDINDRRVAGVIFYDQMREYVEQAAAAAK